MEKLPQDVKFDIFSRLSADSILEYKQVCKSWLSLFNDHSFAQIHLSRQLILLGHHYSNKDDTPYGGDVEFGFIQRPCLNDSDFELLYGKYDENDEQSCKIYKKINHPFMKISNFGASLIILGSCNGLICLSRILSSNGIGEDPTYIFNPITREYVSLPRSFRYSKDCRIMGGFGYHPSTNEYKVVRIFYPNFKENLGQVQVYTLGAGTGWRDKGRVTYQFSSLYLMYGCSATFANGKLHWLDLKENIVAFDLADEEFHFITSPPIVYLDGQMDMFGGHSRRLCVLGGWLGLAHKVCDKIGRSYHLDIWLLKKKKSMVVYDMNEQEYECGGWTKEFTISIDDNVSPLSLTKRGELLFWGSEYDLCRYDPKSATIEKLDKKVYSGDSISHVNSFVSLKALGESVGEVFSKRKCRRRRKYKRA